MALTEWRPSRKQEMFLALPATIKEAFYAGAVGAGKTDVLLTYPIIHKWYENPRFKALFLRRTFPELKNEVIPRSRDYFRPLGAKYNKNDHVWEFPSGALFFFGHCEEEDDIHNYDSMQPNYVAFDELTSFIEWQYLYIVLERIRRNISDKDELPMIARSASNPGNIGHTWVRKRFIDPCPEGLMIIKNPAGIKRIFIPATIDDNPHIDPEYRKSLESLPEAEKQAKLYGKWDAYEGSVFEEFRDKHYPDEPESALHVIEPFDIPDWWPRIVIGDWGFNAMTYVLFGAISPNKKLIIYREMSWTKVKIAEWAPYVKELCIRENPRIVKFCKSAKQDRGQEHTIQQQIEEALGFSISLSDNRPGSRVAGKLLLHEYLRWKKRYVPLKMTEDYSEEYASWLLRNKGDLIYKQYLAQFNPEEDESLPKLLIFNNCKLLINAIKSCVYDKSNVEDVAEFSGDDPYDTIRYAVDTADSYFNDAETEFKKVQAQQTLQDEFEKDRDWNRLYRRARIIEAADANEDGPIQRINYGRSFRIH